MAVLESITDLTGRVIQFIPFILLAFIVYQIGTWVYNLFFHPLRNYPGPFLSKFSCFPYVYHNLAGHVPFWTTTLHEQYGEVVRYSPNELSFSSADAWKDLYGHKKAGAANFHKNPNFYLAPVADEAHRVFDVVNGNDADHSRMRRIFSNAFSDRALKLQEPLFMTYMDKLVYKFNELYQKNPGHKFNMINMYNFTTFDVMADLTFGDSLGMIDRCEYHPWIAAMMSMFRFGVYLHSIRYYKSLEKIVIGLLPRLDPKISENQKLHEKFTHSRVDERLTKEDARPDIWGLVLDKISKDDEISMTRKEMYANANLFMIAGTETTATLLSGLTHYLLMNPDKLKKLCTEIREAFPSGDGITIEKLQGLKYLHGCIEEGLRMYPPISTGLSRVAPPEGAMVAGHFVPGGTCASLTQLSAYRNPNNFKDPYSFIPERWIDDEYASDKKHALQPFSVGPRNCIGKNMAYHEMRLILAKVLWNFDLELCPESKGWINQKVYIMWDKPDLWCTVNPVVRG